MSRKETTRAMLRKLAHLATLGRRVGPLRPDSLGPEEGYRRWAADYGLEPNAFQRLEAAALERLLPDLGGQTVLDLGCGKARASRLAITRGAAVAVAADLSLPMLSDRGALGAPQIHRLACEVPALPFRPDSFDAVICALVLGHVADLGGALSAIAAVLRPGGQLVISDFHPFATLRGWERTFADPESGRTYAIEQHLHLFADYVAGFERMGLRLEALDEPRWRGFPVVFVLRARKRSSPSHSRGEPASRGARIP